MLALIGSSNEIQAQNKILNSQESDPVKLEFMKGFPPEKDKQILKADGSFYTFPKMRYTFSNFREFFPTMPILRKNDVPVSKFKYKLDDKIDEVTFLPLGSDKPMTWKESVFNNYVDGILILHKGKIVYEKYYGALDDEKVHIMMSCTKSVVGTLAAVLSSEGKLDLDAQVISYIPELKGGGFDGATVQQLLDMTTSLVFDETYSNPKADIKAYSIASGIYPRPADYTGPIGYLEYLLTVKKNNYPHGERFSYKSINTDVVAWVISRATDKPIDELITEYFWSKLGMEQDANLQIDEKGTPFASGGLSAGLRDLGRFGEMIRNNGKWNGKQIVPKSEVEKIINGGNLESFNYAGYKTLPGWTYKNMWWVSNNEHQAFSARGIHGQAIYIDPVAEMVIIRLASNPIAANPANDHISLPAYEAVAKYLMEK